jgi:CopG family nickel-responsive transcriptional regulator
MAQGVTRLSVSIPSPLVERLDAVVGEQALPSRSHAVAEMVRRYLLEHAEGVEKGILAGVITVVYANDRNRLRGRLRDLQFRYLKEVISSQHVFLEGAKSLEALLVQGPAKRLHALADEMRRLKGVHSVDLAITAALLPPLHARKTGGTA